MSDLLENTGVPVSMAAKDWKVTPRRIRYLLSQGRLEGRQAINGVWLVLTLTGSLSGGNS